MHLWEVKRLPRKLGITVADSLIPDAGDECETGLGNIFTLTIDESRYANHDNRDKGVAIFVLDVFMGDHTGFTFLDSIDEKFPMAHEDAIIITGKASNDVVNMCIAADITSLLEKPIKSYALQLAVSTIVSKYIKFAKKLLQDPSLIEDIESL